MPRALGYSEKSYFSVSNIHITIEQSEQNSQLINTGCKFYLPTCYYCLYLYVLVMKYRVLRVLITYELNFLNLLSFKSLISNLRFNSTLKTI